MTTMTKTRRTLKVLSSLTRHLLVVAVSEGNRHDEYTVSSSDGAFWWSHTDSSERRYRVDCGPSGPTSCDCPARVPCRHLLATITLIARGELDLPEVDDRETVTDLHANAEEQSDWYDNGPDRLADDETADSLGRRIMREPLGA
jgi:hypothetical protein